MPFPGSGLFPGATTFPGADQLGRLNDVFEDAIYDFLTAVTNIQFIWDKPDSQGAQKGQKPSMPYGTMNISSGPSKVAGSSETYKELDTFTYKHVKAFTLSINIYAQTGHLARIDDILTAFDLPTKQAILRNAGLAVWNIGEPLDISALQNTGFELRGTVDIEMSYGVEMDDVPGEFQTVDIDGTLITDAGTDHVVNINQTIAP